MSIVHRAVELLLPDLPIIADISFLCISRIGILVMLNADLLLCHHADV